MVRSLVLLFFGVVATSVVLQVVVNHRISLPPQRLAIFGVVALAQAAFVTVIARRWRS
jgi:hypothetical protein